MDYYNDKDKNGKQNRINNKPEKDYSDEEENNEEKTAVKEKTAEEEIMDLEKEMDEYKKAKDKRQKRGKRELEVLSIKKAQKEQRVYSSKPEMFRHNKLKNFSSESGQGAKKVCKVLKKVHGVSSEKKIKFVKALRAFNSKFIPYGRKEDIIENEGRKGYNKCQTILNKKTFDKFERMLKHKQFNSQDAKRMIKGGLDPRELRFKKRDIKRMDLAIKGTEDPYKYHGKASLASRNNNRSVPPSGISLRNNSGHK